MSFNGFNFERGVEQGRCAPDHFSQDGDFALVLGHDEPLTFVRLKVGDMMSVHQTKDVGTTKVLKVRCRCRAPEFMPGTTNWRFSIYVDGVEKTFRICQVGQTVDYVNLAVNLSGLVGAHSIAFVLKLAES